MVRFRFFVARLAFFVPLLSFAACFSTQLPGITQPKGFERLLALSNVPVTCTFSNSDASTSLGHQYFAGILPVGRIESESPNQLVFQQLQMEAALRGYRLSNTKVDGAPYSLVVDIQELSVTGYDYFFFRRPSSTVQLKGWLRRGGSETPRYCEISKTASSTRQYAFQPELSHALAEALEGAASDLFNCLRLGPVK